MTIVSLLKTDNQFMTQFVRDYFDTESDILESFSNFINTTLLSLIVQENMETGRYKKEDRKRPVRRRGFHSSEIHRKWNGVFGN